MNISSKRFSVKSDGFGNAQIRDRNAPYHLHTVPLTDIPDTTRAAMMTEREFDRAIAKAIYHD